MCYKPPAMYLSERFNRTFMELKFDRMRRRTGSQGVLIVPLWN